MASFPQRRASQQRPSPAEDDSQQASRLPRTDSEAFSVISEDSQTLLLNRRPTLPTSSSTAPQETADSAADPVAEQPPPAAPAEEPRKCWICFTDETEDDDTTSEWRSPCPCALTAHESCLLDWIADMEAPSSRRRAGGTKGKILCPQCKSEIHLSRPRSVVIETVRAVERFTGVLLLPGVGFSLGYTIFRACIGHGISTIYLVFGIEDGRQILAPLEETIDPTQHGSVLVAGLYYHLRHWRLETGLGLIPAVLIASRTRFSITDNLLPILPIVFFATNPAADEMFEFGSWPPSAALAFGVLPFVRAAYNMYYDKVWAEREKRWYKEIQPRAGEDGANDDANEADGNDILIDENILEINVGVEIADEWGDDEAPELNHQHDPAIPNDQPLENAQNAGPQPDQIGAPAGAPEPQQRPNNQAGNVLLNTTRIADTVLGALVFPSVAAAVGEILRLALPKAWVTMPSSGRPTGLLQQRWGRSLIGGCLFVTVKDAVMLYVRWKLAQNHRKRRVLDWDKEKKRLVRSSRTSMWSL
jgi:hypothetical protein